MHIGVFGIMPRPVIIKFYYFNGDITARLHKITMLKYAVQIIKLFQIFLVDKLIDKR